MAEDSKLEAYIKSKLDAVENYVSFNAEYVDNLCFRKIVNNMYKEILTGKNFYSRIIGDNLIEIREIIGGQFDVSKIYLEAARQVWTDVENRNTAKNQLADCIRQNSASTKKESSQKTSINSAGDDTVEEEIGPFDKRLYRTFWKTDNDKKEVIPFSTKYRESATNGFIISEEVFRNSMPKDVDNGVANIMAARNKLMNDTMNKGVPALQNTYALTKLYGSQGGARLVNKKNERRWYEVDQGFSGAGFDVLSFSKNPTTSSIISWGGGDPYGRTPYHFSDFVYSKYWNKVENNRLITLRRYAAPILDNLKFPGMDGITDIGTAGNDSKDGAVDGGSSKKLIFPPMAQAITYFGEGTNNSLKDILKFSTGMKWGDVKSEVWTVTAESTPDNESGPAGVPLFSSVKSISRMLSVAGGKFDPELIANKGALPPDPYKDGPYENRIMGPVNRIDSVKRREAGLDFKMDGLKLVFEYVDRPIGGVNPKAVILDILSNFLIIGSASAVFFGGQHRFMANPAKYPFPGGQQGIEAWYSGKPLEWGKSTINDFVGQVTDPKGLGGGIKDFFNQLLGKTGEGGLSGIFGAVKGLFTEGNIGSNIIKDQLASKSAGQVPYLSGLKALLTGEPVGEWHVTIGNPFNPIAMIGNLICTGIEVEFGEELGLDDFPTEIKITVNLEHGMARDRDAIQSIFNRGMGRIYDLPDSFQSSADSGTTVDNYTKNQTGEIAGVRGWFAGPSTTGGKSGKPAIKNLAVSGATSVWSAIPFRAVSPNESLTTNEENISRSIYRSADWVALKSLK